MILSSGQGVFKALLDVVATCSYVTLTKSWMDYDGSWRHQLDFKVLLKSQSLDIATWREQWTPLGHVISMLAGPGTCSSCSRFAQVIRRLKLQRFLPDSMGHHRRLPQRAITASRKCLVWQTNKYGTNAGLSEAREGAR